MFAVSVRLILNDLREPNKSSLYANGEVTLARATRHEKSYEDMKMLAYRPTVLHVAYMSLTMESLTK